MGPASTETGPRLRADAVRNRERILTAAREAIVAQGRTDVPLDEIARTAGVGNATLYRHFPDRETLLLHVVLHLHEQVIARFQRACEEESDPFDALRRAVLASAEERTGALFSVLGNSVDMDDPRLEAGRERMRTVVQRLTDRAHACGRLREDIGSGDLVVAMGQLTRPLPGKSCTTDGRFSRRLLQVFLDGLHTPARSALPGGPTTVADLGEED